MSAAPMDPSTCCSVVCTRGLRLLVALFAIGCSNAGATPQDRADDLAEGGREDADQRSDGGGAAPHGRDAQLDAESERDGGAIAEQTLDGGDAGGSVPGAAARADAGMSAVRERASLVEHDRWLRVGTEDDPFDDRPVLVDCAPAAVMVETLGEERVFSVDTEACNYVTAVQSTLRDIRAGDTLKVRLWHFALSADAPAEAHAVLLVGDLPFFDERIPIPQAGGLIARQVKATRAIAAGTHIYFHLHNHGANSWSLVEVSVGP